MRSRSPANNAASSPPVPARTSSIAARSSAASRGSSLTASARSASGNWRSIVGQFLDRPSARSSSSASLVIVSQALALGAQPAHFARGGGDRLDRGIFLGQADEFVGRQVGRRHRRRQAHASAPRSTRSVRTRCWSFGASASARRSNSTRALLGLASAACAALSSCRDPSVADDRACRICAAPVLTARSRRFAECR